MKLLMSRSEYILNILRVYNTIAYITDNTINQMNIHHGPGTESNFDLFTLEELDKWKILL